MFSALKKLTGRSGGGGDGNNGGPMAPPPGLTTMSHSLQKKFGKGVHYNMKIILKGDRNVGKTQLFRRLQGLAFLEEYTATEEIQVANITWNYKNSEDIVKVEIWDIVDVANKKKRFPTDKLKLENSGGQENGDSGGQEFGLDANTIDVYKNTNGVILVFDITKLWTFDYVKREIDNVPEHIPILIMGNRRDMGHHRAVASDTVTYFIEGLERDTCEIRYTESSMRNGFGLKFLHKFFNLPYLHLQKEALLKQLEVNRQETEITIQELEYYAEGDDANYDLFMDSLSQKRRQVADALSPPKLSLAEAQAIASAKALKDAKGIEEKAAVAARLAIKSDPTTNRPLDLPRAAATTSISNSSGSAGVNPSELNSKLQKSGSGLVEDFVPDDDIHKIISFLDDGFNNGTSQQQQQQQQSKTNLHFDSSSDEEGGRGGTGNPMVIALEEDVQEEEFIPKNLAKIIVPSTTTTMSSSEDEKEAGAGPHPQKEEEEGDFNLKKGSKLGFQQVFVQEEFKEEEKLKSSKKSHHKKSKHSKKKKHHQSQGQPVDLEEFLSGEPGSQLPIVDTSAYEAL